ncbi:MAG: hypothetical protein ACXABY_14765 [Candidatus Thorarchaeota archaeon]|jgi:hypothetical protein
MDVYTTSIQRLGGCTWGVRRIDTRTGYFAANPNHKMCVTPVLHDINVNMKGKGIQMTRMILLTVWITIQAVLTTNSLGENEIDGATWLGKMANIGIWTALVLTWG